MDAMSIAPSAELDLEGQSHQLAGLQLKLGDAASGTILEADGSSTVPFKCERILVSASDGDGPNGEFSLDEATSPENPAGEFVVDGSPYPIVGGTLTIRSLGDGTAEVELAGQTEEIEYSGCDCIAREVAFKVEGLATLKR